MTYGLGGNHPIVIMCCGAGPDLFAENSSPTQVSMRFTDQVQTKEPVGNGERMEAR